jgi:hypothetical protein
MIVGYKRVVLWDTGRRAQLPIVFAILVGIFTRIFAREVRAHIKSVCSIDMKDRVLAHVAGIIYGEFEYYVNPVTIPFFSPTRLFCVGGEKRLDPRDPILVFG